MNLTQGSLADFRACRRRFELRYRQRLPWPAAVLDEAATRSRDLGTLFHQIVHRFFLGLPPGEAAAEPTIEAWWRRFEALEPELPAGRRLPELTVAVPLGGRSLAGRFDLLILDPDRACIYDWKTEAKPRSEADLRRSEQTRLYLALAAEALPALGGPSSPEAISLTYWYAADPARSATIAYSQIEHDENRRALAAAVAELERLLDRDEPWPLTDDLAECGRCAYPLYCRRAPETIDLAAWVAEVDVADLEPWLP